MPIATHKAEIPDDIETSPLASLFETEERRFERDWRRVRREQAERLAALGSAPAILASLQSEPFITQWENELVSAIAPFLNSVYLVGANDIADELTEQLALSIDTGQLNARAAEWASEQSARLVKRRSRMFKQTITETDIETIRQEIKLWVEAGEDYPQLVRRLNAFILDPGRASLIASTESTRSYAQAAVDGFIDAGLIDKRPKNEQLPPAHPRCRCWVVYSTSKKAVVWKTAMDERVCPICGPRNNEDVSEI